MGGERLTDEEMQSFVEKVIHDFTLHVGMAPSDQRRLHARCRERFQTEGKKFVFHVPPGEISAFIDGMQLVLGADVEHELAAFLDDFPAEILLLNAYDE